MSAAGAVYDERVHTFLTDKGYSIRELPRHPMHDRATTAEDIQENIPAGTRSWFHLEVRPPLTPEDTRALGSFLARGIVDPYHNEAFLIDHRADSPTANQIITSW